MTFLEIQKNSIRDSPYLVHSEIRQKRGQNGEKKGQKKGVGEASQKYGANKRLEGDALKDRAVWKLWVNFKGQVIILTNF